jgi:hypothetical protein
LIATKDMLISGTGHYEPVSKEKPQARTSPRYPSFTSLIVELVLVLGAVPSTAIEFENDFLSFGVASLRDNENRILVLIRRLKPLEHRADRQLEPREESAA